MSIKSILITIAIACTSQAFAGPLYQFNNQPLTINSCPFTGTGNTLDFALSNKGYFIVSPSKQVNELLFTRYARMRLDAENYVQNQEGEYLLSVSKNSDSKHLSKIKINTKNLPPKATTKIKIVANFPAMEEGNIYHQTNLYLYDSLSKKHLLSIRFVKIQADKWRVKVVVDKVEREEGLLNFTPKGIFSKQEGLSNVQWPADYGMNELKIDLKGSTQYAAPFAVELAHSNGYDLGTLIGLSVSRNGEFELRYTNGQMRTSKKRIAVAMFPNPGYLQKVTEHLYKPTDLSGNPMIHWINGEYSILSGYLEEENCLMN